MTTCNQKCLMLKISEMCSVATIFSIMLFFSTEYNLFRIIGITCFSMSTITLIIGILKYETNSKNTSYPDY